MLSNVALLYYGEGLTQGEIARRMQVSRATIVNMLKDCRDLGIVDIRVEGKHLKGSTLSRELRDKFDLQDVYVAQYGEVAVGDDQDGPVAPSGARCFDRNHRCHPAWRSCRNRLGRDNDLGGRRDAVPFRQQCRNLPVDRVDDFRTGRGVGKLYDPDRAQAGARSYTLHAPSLISTAELADRLRSEPTIRTQLERLRTLDMTIASVGNVEPETHLVAAGIATRQELEDARAAGAVGVICCRYLDVDGQEVEMPPNDRLVAADIRDLRAAGKRLLAVCGLDRAAATLAAIRGGLVTHLCVDQFLGKALLDA